MARTAFVTGGTGFLGKNLIPLLVEAGWRVRALCRPTADREYLDRFGVEIRTGDLGDPDSLFAAMPDEVDAVFHMAAYVTFWRPNRKRQYEANVVGTRNLIRAALARKARRFVHTSSFVTFGNLGSTITEETRSDAHRSKVGYQSTKYWSEVEVKQAVSEGLDAVILNPSNILGPHDLTGWSRIFRMVYRGTLAGISPGMTTFCHSEEVARAHIAAVDRGRTGENYLLGGADASYLELVQATGKLLGREVPKRPIPGFLFKGFGLLNDLASIATRKEPDIGYDLAVFLSNKFCCTSDKAIRELGYAPRPLDAMLADCFAWMRTEGML